MQEWNRRRAAIAMAASLATALTACGGNDDDAPVDQVLSLVDTAKADARFSVLVEAVVAADLVGALSVPGPLTVFAPTNDAFTALLAELGLSKAQLLANKPLLTAVLQYHVLGTRVFKSQVEAGKPISPLTGGIFKIDAVGSDLVVTDGRNRTAKILATDVRCSNGIIHVIDKVLLPADKNIVQTAQALPQFSILVEAVVAANLQGTLSSTGPFTVFAPTNDAFAALLAELNLSKAALLANTALLTQVLTYHVLPARVLKAEVPVSTATTPAPITTVQGATFTVDGSLAITDGRGRKANIVVTDVLTSNGVIHAIDKVILPPV